MHTVHTLYIFQLQTRHAIKTGNKEKQKQEKEREKKEASRKGCLEVIPMRKLP